MMFDDRFCPDHERASLPGASDYRQLRDAVWSVAERRGPYGSSPQEVPTEHLLHLLWRQQELFRQPLQTLDGRRVTVYRPGRWSRGSGPDFLEAKLRFGDGPIQVGAVEIHVQASDWFHHGHDRDPAYTDVLLHVVWTNDVRDNTVANTQGMRLPQIELSGSLLRPLADLQEALDVEGSLLGATARPTPCQRVLQEMPVDTIGPRGYDESLMGRKVTDSTLPRKTS
jgi:hypothetical protein